MPADIRDEGMMRPVACCIELSVLPLVAGMVFVVQANGRNERGLPQTFAELFIAARRRSRGFGGHLARGIVKSSFTARTEAKFRVVKGGDSSSSALLRGFESCPGITTPGELCG